MFPAKLDEACATAGMLVRGSLSESESAAVERSRSCSAKIKVNRKSPSLSPMERQGWGLSSEVKRLWPFGYAFVS